VNPIVDQFDNNLVVDQFDNDPIVDQFYEDYGMGYSWLNDFGYINILL